MFIINKMFLSVLCCLCISARFKTIPNMAIVVVWMVVDFDKVCVYTHNFLRDDIVNDK